MAYKFRRVLAPTRLHLLEEIHDFVVNDLGWTDETPSGQDDELGVALGYFLRSDGEDGKKDICAHLKVVPSPSSGSQVPYFEYLTAGITTTTQMSCTVRSGTIFSGLTTPFIVRIDDEAIMVSSVVSNTLNFSQRGINGTTRATHSIGAQVAASEAMRIGCEIFAARDWDTPIRETTSGVVIDYTQTTIAEFASEGTDRFSYGYVLLKDRTSGKMRLVYDYNTSTGAFTYAPFKDYIGGPNQVDLLSVGFYPCWSIRAKEYFSNIYYLARESFNPGPNDAFLYGSKDGFYVILKEAETYRVYYCGSYTTYAAPEFTEITAGISAGATSIPVTDRRLFMPNGKYRIVSMDAQDWVDNEDRSGEGWPDLDPEEGVGEEFVISSITPGAGNAGTLIVSAPLRYSYTAGSKPAVLGEDPRPGVRTNGYTIHYISAVTDTHLFADRTWYGAVVTFLPGPADDLTGHASHRQTWRVHHTPGAPQTPRNSSNDVDRFLQKLYFIANPDGDYDSVMEGMNPNYVNDRTQMIIPEIGTFDVSSASSHYQEGAFPTMFGTLPGMWIKPDTDWTMGGNEDVFYSRWLGTYEKFRLFQTYTYDKSNEWVLFGPEL
jgi:hypothetical protein